jgi:hypothetical protein
MVTDTIRKEFLCMRHRGRQLVGKFDHVMVAFLITGQLALINSDPAAVARMFQVLSIIAEFLGVPIWRLKQQLKNESLFPRVPAAGP